MLSSDFVFLQNSDMLNSESWFYATSLSLKLDPNSCPFKVRIHEKNKSELKFSHVTPNLFCSFEISI